ncbi:glycosyltransferase family 4 protein [Rhodocytophaga aerolata]|uniref:Glycosyltransferase family 4 protein n=1 Tax=Rhodocytophaga aerolata TaxID=455078 RepID=A0ABT8RGJ5_9BACT|nr:glycosyltransferase family 4 protein [Rhodocytophaga aerolata]MDO1451215.1 glycosyltransferase family 4 protein [Rhodocytophaga aerolata]
MKILTIVYNLGKGGTQRAAQNFCEAYNKLGYESKILAMYEGGFRREELENEQIKVWVTNSDSNLMEIKNWNPDVIHIHSHKLEKKDIFSIKEKCNQAKIVETNVFSYPSPFTEVVDISYQLAEWCRFLYEVRGGSNAKSVVVPYPVKVSSFFKASPQECATFKSKYNIPQDAFIFGRIGQHFLGKWSLYLIDVFERFIKEQTEEAYLLIVNPPKAIVSYIHDRKLSDKVIIIDQIIGDDELRKCYSCIDLFLHIANQGESFGLVLAETLLCETPIIALNTPWGDNSQAEVIGNNIGGICTDTVDEFYKSMVKLYNDRTLLQKLGQNGRKHIMSKYDYLIVAKQSVDIITHYKNDNSSTLSTLEVVKKLNFVKSPLAIILLWIKLHNSKSHRLVNFLLKKLANYNTKKQFKYIESI